MTRSERHPVSRDSHPWTVIGGHTIRVILRDALFRTEVLLLTLLTALAAVATQGSPNAGDSAIQMVAVSYTIIPFFLVLVIGQLTLRADVETAWWSRPIARADYYVGRFLGIIVVGIVVLGAQALLGSILSAAFAHLPIFPSLFWNLGLMAGFALPSLFLLAGVYLWLAEITGGGHHYYPWAIVSALVIAFAEYKLPRLLAMDPRLGFFNPLPAFLSLGLTMPAGLIGAFPLPGWLVVNRLAWMGFGVLFLTLAISHSTGFARRYYQRYYRVRIVSGLISALFVATAVVYVPWVRSLSPGSNLTGLVSASRLLTRPADVQLQINAKTGIIAGVESISVPRYAVPPAAILLNRGLTITAIRLGGRPIRWSTLHPKTVIAGTSAGVEQLAIKTSPGGTLVIRYQGHVLPYPSPIAYRPFETATHVYERIEAGSGRVFLDGIGSWIPEPLAVKAPASGSGYLVLPVKGHLHLQIAGLNRNDHIASNLSQSTTAKHRAWSGSLSHPLFMAAPFAETSADGLTVFTRWRPTVRQWQILEQYGSAWSTIRSMFPTASQGLLVAENPLATDAYLSRGVLAISGLHPYVEPVDLIGNTTRVPRLLEAEGMLARLWWQGDLDQLGTYAWQSKGMQSTKLAPPLAVLTVLHSASKTTAKVLERAVRHHQSIPGIGPLSRSQSALVEELAKVARHRSSRAWQSTLATLPQHWAALDNQPAVIAWILQHHH